MADISQWKGAAVVRGKDWQFEDHDGGAGSIGQVVETGQKHWVQVKWPTGRLAFYHIHPDAPEFIRVVHQEKPAVFEQKVANPGLDLLASTATSRPRAPAVVLLSGPKPGLSLQCFDNQGASIQAAHVIRDVLHRSAAASINEDSFALLHPNHGRIEFTERKQRDNWVTIFPQPEVPPQYHSQQPFKLPAESWFLQFEFKFIFDKETFQNTQPLQMMLVTLPASLKRSIIPQSQPFSPPAHLICPLTPLCPEVYDYDMITCEQVGDCCFKLLQFRPVADKFADRAFDIDGKQDNSQSLYQFGDTNCVVSKSTDYLCFVWTTDLKGALQYTSTQFGHTISVCCNHWLRMAVAPLTISARRNLHWLGIQFDQKSLLRTRPIATLDISRIHFSED